VLLLLFFGLFFQVKAQDTVRICHYNLLEYGVSGTTCPTTSDKNTWMKLFMPKIAPDILTVNEIGGSSGLYAENILQNVLQTFNPAFERAAYTNNTGSSIVNAFFYNSDKFGIYDEQVISHSLRDINFVSLYYKDASLPLTLDTIFLHFVVIHYKAYSSPSDGNTQVSQGWAVMNFLDAFGKPGNFILSGDLNVSSSNDSSYKVLTKHGNPDICFQDPVNTPGTWGSVAYQTVHTQSTKITATPNCGAGGGMDDRFDQILVSNFVMNDSDRVHYIPGSYFAYGNDGNLYNDAITSSTSVPAQIANALHDNSDHLPVVMDLAIAGTTVSLIPGIGCRLCGIDIGPNPFENEFKIDLAKTGASGPFTLSVFNMNGRILVQEHGILNGRKIQVATESLPSGLYHVNLSAANGELVAKKLIKW